jgi:hypothetical protein
VRQSFSVRRLAERFHKKLGELVETDFLPENALCKVLRDLSSAVEAHCQEILTDDPQDFFLECLLVRCEGLLPYRELLRAERKKLFRAAFLRLIFQESYPSIVKSTHRMQGKNTHFVTNWIPLWLTFIFTDAVWWMASQDTLELEQIMAFLNDWLLEFAPLTQKVKLN